MGTEMCTVKARDFKRLADPQERWNQEAVMQSKGTLWEPVPGTQDDSIPVHVRLLEEESPLEPPENAGIPTEPQKEIRRRARITRDEVMKAGFTIGCPGCRAISRNAPSQNHTEVCRKRIEEALIAQGGASAKRIAEGNTRYEKHLDKRRRAEAQEEDEEQRKRQASEEEGGGGGQSSKQPRRERKSGKRALEEEGNEEENPAKFQQLDDDSDHDENMQERDGDEMAIGVVHNHDEKRYWDDLSGKPLIPELVEKARLEELGEIAKHGVYEKVPIDDCWKSTGCPPIGTRWVDVNKGDDQNPDYRSRLGAGNQQPEA